MNRLLLVDGHNLLFKAFYGVPERLLPDGTPVHGLIGFIGILRKVIKKTEPSHLLVVFDPEEDYSRRQQYPQYKANRHDFGGLPDRENPFSQLSGIKQALDNLGIRWVEQSGHEADDMIASYTVKSRCQTIIASSDADFFQLVSNQISVFRYRGEKSTTFDEAQIMTRYGVTPARFLEYRALTGDKVDNIPGLKGVGPKTAARILNGERVLSQEESRLFEMNRDLMRLNTEIELPYSIEELPLDARIFHVEIGSLLSLGKA